MESNIYTTHCILVSTKEPTKDTKWKKDKYWFTYIYITYILFTKGTDFHFRVLWLAPVARDIHD